MQSSDHNDKARIIKATTPTRILVANAKGGSGKTTIATNLVSTFAARAEHCALIDFDPQASATQWLSLRHRQSTPIHGVTANKKGGMQTTRAWHIRNIPNNTQKVVIDTPAGLTGTLLNDLIRECDIIIIPVTPSPIDIRATTHFIKDVFLSAAFRTRPKKLTVIANRVRKNTVVYAKLELFLNSLKIPMVTTFRDTQYYIKASEYGLGVIDLKKPTPTDLDDWQKLVSWIDQHSEESSS